MQDFFLQIKDLVLSRTAKDTSVVFVGNAVSFLFGIIFTIVAARQIDPADWGVFSAAIGFVGILLAVGELGLTSGLFKFVSNLWAKGSKEKAEKVLSTIFTMRLVSATLISIFVVLFSGYISKNVFKLEGAEISWIAAGGLFLFLLNDFQITILQSKSRWKIASVFSALNNFFRLILISILPKFFGLSLLSLASIFFLSPIFTLLLSFVFERPRVMIDKDFKKLFKKISRFSFWMGANRTAGAISSRVDAVLLLQLATPTQAGLVGVARQLSNAVLVLIASFATVVAPRFSTYKGAHLKNYFKKTFVLSAIIGAAILLGVLFVDPIVSLLGPKYTASSGVFKGLLITLVPFALFTPSVNALIYSYNKPQIIALLSILQLPLVVLGNIYAIPRWGIFGPVVVLAAWNLSTFFVSYYFSIRQLLRKK